jgi:HAD superfamily hydrolase (TIGR01490 family)
MNLALFDLDNTLLSGDTDYEWHSFLVEEGALPAAAKHENEAMDARYRDGTADVLEYVRFYLRPYPAHDMETLLSWRAKFLERMRKLVVPGARRLLDSHRQDLVAIITATNRFLTEPIAALLGVEHLIATEPQTRNGRFTGDIVGAPCMREGKIARLDTWLAGRGATLAAFDKTWFYSDSINDLPLLGRVSNPVVVHPDAALAAEAERRGWPSLSLL